MNRPSLLIIASGPDGSAPVALGVQLVPAQRATLQSPAPLPALMPLWLGAVLVAAAVLLRQRQRLFAPAKRRGASLAEIPVTRPVAGHVSHSG